MARRRVQYGIVDASDADVGAGAPGFRTTWHSKGDLRQQLMEIDDVPKDGRLYFWDGELWLRWEAPDDLPGPEQDPLRVKVVRPQNAVEMVDCETNEPSIKPFTVPRNWRGQLDVEAIEKSLAASQHILEGIVHGNRHGYPACKDGWTRTSYTGTPIQIQVAPKPVEDEGYKSKDLMHKWALLGVAVCVCIVWTIYYGVWGRSPGNPPTG